MAFVVVLAAFVLVALGAAWLGADSRPHAGMPPEQQWPFNRHGG